MAISPMMKHYLEVKEKYKDSIVFYRLGDFYEMFFEDAITASKVLDLVLTGRDCGLEQKAPMCGIPFHAADNYITKLVAEGFKVAICEQLSQPMPGKIVERGVVRVITPGTIVDESMLDNNKNNYIMAVGIFAKNQNAKDSIKEKDNIKENISKNIKYNAKDNIKEFSKDNILAVGAAYCDISTGEFVVEELTGTLDKMLQDLNELIVRVSPSEIIAKKESLNILKEMQAIKLNVVGYIGEISEEDFNEEKSLEYIKEQFGEDYNSYFKKDKFALQTAGALLKYIKDTQKRGLAHINQIKQSKEETFMQLDVNTRRNLELTETIRERKKRGSLLHLLDYTSTCMGGRLFRSWIMNPLQDDIEINRRLDSIEEMISNIILRESLHNNLKNITDIERIAGRIAYGNFNPKDALALKKACEQMPAIKEILEKFESEKLKSFKNEFDELSDILEVLENSIAEDAPALLREGRVIKFGFNSDLDELRNAEKEASKWLSDLEAKERELTGIKNLKIAYNRVFGYFIEVNKSQIANVPYRYQRKQTTVNNERYITDDLKLIEEKVLGAGEQALKLEIQIFEEIRDFLLSNLKRIQKTSKILAELDCFLSGAIVATKYNYCKPKISKRIKHVKIEAGRHPVVESFLKGDFVANDTYLNCNTDKSMIITGPNMAGKSTYMRQVALITLIAHTGLFVPANSAEISITDKIFTRIGASDDVAFGQSTFMVEMSEVAHILKNATDRSLIILDEIGRGTSTFDGLSIAWAVMEHITNKMNTKTLFSTHYHELTELEGFLPGVKNYKITVKEFNDEIIFLRKIVRGGAYKSFGVAVAKLADLPEEVIDRAKEISLNLEKADINRKITESNLGHHENFEEIQQSGSQIVGILKDININKITPLSAFEILSDLIKKVEE